MKVKVNNVDLYFDVDGAKLRAHGSEMKVVPTLVLLHGGPGADHSIYKPRFASLVDIAQIVYLDHRGNGRSDRADESTWNLAQWADDVAAFCNALSIDKPIVYGASFGGMVAMQYAIRHPLHPLGLVLDSTSAYGASHAAAKVAMFRRLGGEAAGELARRRFVDLDTSPEVLSAWLETALPLYTQRPLDPAVWARIESSREVTAWFNRAGGEMQTYNLLPVLDEVKCSTLVMGGVLDPMLPIECQRDIAAALPKHLVTYREFEGCGHAAMTDAPERAESALREFIADLSANV